MILFNGCSWTYGDELSDPVTEGYPYLLASKLNMEFVNLARNGASNDYIFHRTVSYLLHSTPSLVVVQWTYPTRFGLYSEGSWNDYVPNSFTTYKFTHKKRDEFGNKIFKYLSIEEDPSLAYLRSYAYMISLYNFCKVQNIPYICFSNNDYLSKELREVHPDLFDNYFSRLKDKVINISEITWIEHIKASISDKSKRKHKYGHPTEHAHSLWSSYLYGIVEEKYNQLLH
jgi:hypothetical protein